MKANGEVAQLANAMLRLRRFRSQVFSPDICGEPAWELLLEVFVADANGLPVTGRIVAERNGVAGPVMSRWLKHLTAEGLLITEMTGSLDDELTLSGLGMDKVETVLCEADVLKNEFMGFQGRRSTS